MTVEKPSNGLKNDILQKSAKTNANTMQVSLLSGHPFSPKDKIDGVSDVDDYSEKFTPENATNMRQDQPTSSMKHARQLKQQAKEMEQI